MCTALVYRANSSYFGRNLDLERVYNESVTVTPRAYPFEYRCGERSESHYAMIGMATVVDGYPLYYEATNEHGLSMAGLNFVGNAYLSPAPTSDRKPLAPYELIPYILGRCKTVREARGELSGIELVDIPFSDAFKNGQLHWMIADRTECIVLENMKDGAVIHDCPPEVLTNNPPFEYQMMNLNNYIGLSPRQPECTFSDKLALSCYSRGMGALGLPGDLSSASRFVRAAFVKNNASIANDEESAVTQTFHILGSVEQVEGTVAVGDEFERTQYSSCCNIDSGVYYYRTYGNSRICAVDMFAEDLDSARTISYGLVTSQQIKYINRDKRIF